MSLRPYTREDFEAKRPAVTRSGIKVRHIEWFDTDSHYPYVVIYDNHISRHLTKRFTILIGSDDSDLDLMIEEPDEIVKGYAPFNYGEFYYETLEETKADCPTADFYLEIEANKTTKEVSVKVYKR